jgi:GNAT superfamily N-acetyltransferase
MSELPAPYVLRTGRSGELTRAVAIDDSGAELFAGLGIHFEIPEHHPYVQAERMRWQLALERGDLAFACHAGEPVGFFVLDRLADRPYLEQLSVRHDRGRRGLGRALLEAVCARCAEQGDAELWLTTYAHVPWNAPFYARCGFEQVPEASCSPELQAVLEEQRGALPAPEQRVAMRKRL